jgi:hypothetical protein
MNILLISLLLLTQSTDEVRNFISEDNSVKWQKVYESDKSPSGLNNFFKSNSIVKNIDSQYESMSFDLDLLLIDYKGAGVSKANQPAQIANAFLIAHATVEYKVGKYRVTVTNIKVSKENHNLLDEENEPVELESFSINSSGMFGGRFKGDASKILDHTFDQFFGMKVVEEEDNW